MDKKTNRRKKVYQNKKNSSRERKFVIFKTKETTKDIISNPKKFGIDECFLCYDKNIVAVGAFIPDDNTIENTELIKDKVMFYGFCKKCFLKRQKSAEKVEEIVFANPDKYFYNQPGKTNGF